MTRNRLRGGLVATTVLILGVFSTFASEGPGKEIPQSISEFETSLGDKLDKIHTALLVLHDDLSVHGLGVDQRKLKAGRKQEVVSWR
jgi:hypothetical protein